MRSNLRKMEYENSIKIFDVFTTDDLINFLRIFRQLSRAGDSEACRNAVIIKRILKKRKNHLIDSVFPTDPRILERGPERRNYKRRKN